jgi:hypothetical protein
LEKNVDKQLKMDKVLFFLLIVFQCISLTKSQLCNLFPPVFKYSPGQLRVALRGANGVTVSWRTSGFYGSNDTPNPQVVYSTDSTLLGAVHSSVGTSSTYDKTSYFHNVALLNLSPSTKYYYRIVASSPCVLQSNIQSFKTPPVTGVSNSINITLVGDLGINNLINFGGASATMKGLLQSAEKTHFFIHSGDISYADDYPLNSLTSPYETTWNSWQNSMTALTSNNIYMTAPGNHEATCFQESDFLCELLSLNQYRNFSAYLNRFRMPGDESGGYKNMWYSFDYGLVHVVVINTETDFPNAPAGPGTTLNSGHFQGLTQQLSWFENDLQAANANRDQVPWILVTGHRPFYGSLPKFPAVPGNCDSCRLAFEPLIITYNVDFYFCGHVHWYERLYPIDANGNALATNYNNQSGPIHITNGAGGAAEGKASVKSTIAASAKIVSAYGYARLELKDASNARLSFVDSSTLQEVDSVNIFRQH